MINNLYIQNKTNDSIIISNGFQYTFFYNKEPDYYLRSGNKNYFCKELNGNCYVNYMNKTILIYNKEQFYNIITNSNKTVYIIFNLKGGHLDLAKKSEDWIREYENKGNKFEKVFIGKEPYSKVYQLQNA